MERYDVVVIGGGVLGCFAARNLCRWQLRTALVEGAEDVCTGITRANAAICYAGYDHAPGSAKANFTRKANEDMDALCAELEVPFRRPGGLMTACGPKGEAVLQKKLAQGQYKQVPGLRILSGAEAREREPMLPESVTAALYSPTTGTVNPWQLGIAAMENAAANGCTVKLGSPVLGIARESGGYVVQTAREELFCKVVLNCAGLAAPQVQEMLFDPRVRLYPDASDFYVFDRCAPSPSHVLFQEREAGKGITAIPTTEGNLMLASPARPLSGALFSTTREGLASLRAAAEEYLPSLDWSAVIRNFGAVRPNPRNVVLRNGQWVPEDRNIPSFVIDRPEPGFLSLIGIKTPGLTCADQLGGYLAEEAAALLQAQKNPEFQPIRRAIPRDSSSADIICRCEGIEKTAVLEAIRRGATTTDGIKRRLGTGMGFCQGSRCTRELEKLLREYGHGTH